MEKLNGVNRFQKIFAHCFLVVATVCLTFFVLETLSRWIFPGVTPVGDQLSYDTQKKPAPYTMFSGRVEGQPEGLEINSLGYRGRDPRFSKLPGEFRIFVLGGSTVYNGGPAIPQWLERQFHRKGQTNVTVFNFGIPSSKSGEELARILYEVVNYRPDMVVMYDGGNDIDDPCGDPRPGYPFNFLVYESNPLMIKKVQEYPTWSLLAYGSNLLRLIFKDQFVYYFLSINKLRDEYSYRTPSWAHKVADKYVENVGKAYQLSKGFNFELMVFFQPLKTYQDYYKKTSREDLPDSYEPKTHHALIGRQQILKKILPLQKAGLKFFNISNIFNDKSGKIFSDNIHTYQPWTEKIATVIFDKMQGEVVALIRARETTGLTSR